MDIETTNKAVYDLNINSIPNRNEEGVYAWSLGQESILKEKGKAIHQLFATIKKLDVQIQELKDELKSLKDPTEQIIDDIETKIKDLIDEREYLKATLETNIDEQKKYKGILQSRGSTYLDVENGVKKSGEGSSKNTNKDKKTWGDSLKAWGIGLLTYGAIEAFMTFSQYLSLRETRSLNEVLFRSGVFAFLLVFTHVAKHAKEKYGKQIHALYLYFNIAMMAIMIFSPPILSFIYPAEGTAVNETVEWQLTDDQTDQVIEDNATTNSRPEWVNTYLTYDWLPAALGGFIGIAIYFIYGFRGFGKSPRGFDRSLDEDQKDDGNADDPILNRLKNLKHEERILREEINQIQTEIKSLQSNPIKVVEINNLHKNLDSKITENKERKAEKVKELKALLAQIESKLTEYKAEFKDVLGRDEVKESLITPDWPTHDDILEYFNINTNSTYYE